jgi:hypothetical protein
VGRANDAYNKAYIAMLEEDDLDYEAHCATFNAVVDTLTMTEALALEVNLGIIESSHSDTNNPMEPEYTEDPWSSLLVNLLELEELNNKPFKSVYEPSPMWEHPPGHALEGVDAFKVYCYINNLKELATLVVGDSGTVLTLILKEFLDSLKTLSLRLWAGHKLKLIQLTGSAKCSQCVCLNLYFHSQIGPVCLKGVEAYIVNDMEADLLVGEDTQCTWQLQTEN